ncbi:hypothetical protein I601_1628 [Nocardioides dokdonensis FR1436]|uniref:Uncharacterized protein n=1 Tax=Nocardioides dokdonensis FR1436 TaxID=1300347 RepID=A0A1A9GK53_9ACTN|nr:hypothetical protein [Nocardioides dokdonensis]ANH38060.1 hypothetical protein I601_1628 [Nocardioides dokdonensis FR1436]
MALVPGPGDALSTAVGVVLNELRIDAVVIEGILEDLELGREELEKPFDAVPARRFGDLPRGAEMGQHTQLARDTVREAMRTLLTDLGHFGEGVRVFREGFNTTDTHSADNIRAITAQVSQAGFGTEGGGS